MAEVSREDAEAAADNLLPLISRVAPEAIERAELVDTSGLTTEEARAALAVLVETERVIETEDGGYRLSGPSAPHPDAAASSGGEDEGGEAPETGDPASPASVPGSGQNYRVAFNVTATYGAMRDEAALQTAGAMEEEIADLIHEKYPGSVISVDVARIEAYKPRVIFGDGA